MMEAADQHLDETRADLRWTDQGSEADRRCKGDTLRLQDGEQMDRDDCRDHRADHDRGGEDEEDRVDPPDVRGPRRGGDGCAFPGRQRAARQRQQIDRQCDDKMDRGIARAGAAPAEMRNQEGGERPAGGARQTAEQGQRGDAIPRCRAVEPAQG